MANVNPQEHRHRRPVQPAALTDFCAAVLERAGLSTEDARVTADVLVAADIRGIDSHGVARLGFYLDLLRSGVVNPNPAEQIVTDTGCITVIDAGGGMGHPSSCRAMERAVRQGADTGVGIVSVRNSNHYGIAGYYAMMALDYDCIGISMTNSAVFVVPTHGRSAMLGTNPIAVAAPAGEERPFVLDMATSTVPLGKLETYDRLAASIPKGWAIDETGLPADDPAHVLECLKTDAGGGLLPLGGHGEMLGGHKGYGLALLVDILCGALAGALYADLVYPRTEDGKRLPSGIGHFFLALRIDAFRPLGEFKKDMDDLQRRLRSSARSEGQARIRIHGEREFEAAERRSRQGIPLDDSLMAQLEQIAREWQVEFHAR